MRLPLTALLISLTVPIGLVACDSHSPETAPPPDYPVALPETDPALATATREAWLQGERWLADAGSCATELHQRIETFLESPDESMLETAQAQWAQCQRLWQYSALLRTLGSSSPGLFGDLEQHNFNIGAPVLMPGYIDALNDYPYSGVVMDTTVAISVDALRQQHGLTDDDDVILGFYALEFLLTGEDGQRSDAYRIQEEPDERGLSVADMPNNRRRELLRLVSQLLQEDLRTLYHQWQYDEGPLKLPYLSLPGESRLQLLHSATRKMLTELYEERPEQAAMAAALAGMEQLLVHGDPALAQWLEPSDWQDTLTALLAALSPAELPAELPDDESTDDSPTDDPTEEDNDIETLLRQLIEQI